LFAATWRHAAHRRLPVDPRPSMPLIPGERGRIAASAGLGAKEITRSVVKHIRKSDRRVWLATAYFWPSGRLRRALRRAARRGLNVRVLVPGPQTDHPAIRAVGRLFYPRLLRNGVVIFEYQPGFVHTKLVLCDDWASVGSSNLDRWGLQWNLDANQEVDSPAFAAQAAAIFERCFADSIELSAADPLQQTLRVQFWRLLAQAIFAWSRRALARLRR
jgi:cardiolipin synthase A/B